VALNTTQRENFGFTALAGYTNSGPVITPVTGFVGSIDNVSMRQATLGKTFAIKHNGAGVLTVTSTTCTIDGLASFTMGAGDAVTLIYTGAGTWSKL
jgi:hypothetical protein